MQTATYRGTQYVVTDVVAETTDAQLTYRGVEHNPAEQEVAPADDADLIYRGVGYRAIRQQTSKDCPPGSCPQSFHP